MDKSFGMGIVLLVSALNVQATLAETASITNRCSMDIVPNKAAQLARTVAQQQGISLTRYEERLVTYSFTQKNWRIGFFPDRSAPFDEHLPWCIFVHIDDRTREATISTCPLD